MGLLKLNFVPRLENHCDIQVVAAVCRWRDAKGSFWYVVVHCSQGAQEKENMVEYKANNVQGFEVISWTLEECLDAVKIPDFWISVKDKRIWQWLPFRSEFFC